MTATSVITATEVVPPGKARARGTTAAQPPTTGIGVSAGPALRWRRSACSRRTAEPPRPVRVPVTRLLRVRWGSGRCRHRGRPENRRCTHRRRCPAVAEADAWVTRPRTGGADLMPVPARHFGRRHTVIANGMAARRMSSDPERSPSRPSSFPRVGVRHPPPVHRPPFCESLSHPNPSGGISHVRHHRHRHRQPGRGARPQ